MEDIEKLREENRRLKEIAKELVTKYNEALMVDAGYYWDSYLGKPLDKLEALMEEINDQRSEDATGEDPPPSRSPEAMRFCKPQVSANYRGPEYLEPPLLR